MIEIHIPYPATKNMQKMWNAEYGMNAIYAGKHWSKRSQDAQLWHYMVNGELNKIKGGYKMFDSPVIITFYFNDRLDVSNHAYIVKLIEDGLKGRVIKDDSQKYVKGIEMYLHKENFIKVVIAETL